MVIVVVAVRVFDFVTVVVCVFPRYPIKTPTNKAATTKTETIVPFN